jgi:tetratricopeptide (TPR) repeat protein
MRRILLYCLLVFSGSVYSQRGVETVINVENNNGKIWAVLVGVSDYKELPDLKYADRDADLMRFYFEEGLKVKKDNVVLLVNKEATKTKIALALEFIEKKIQKGDQVFFYFAGHGDIEADSLSDDHALLLLHNSYKINYLQDPTKEFLELSELREWMNKLSEKGGKVYFISDACRSGAMDFIGKTRGRERTQRGLINSWKNQITFLSCQPNELSIEAARFGNGHGAYTFALSKALSGDAKGKYKSVLTTKDVNKYLDEELPKLVNPDKQNSQGNGGDVTVKMVDVDTTFYPKFLAYTQTTFPVFSTVRYKGGQESIIQEKDSTFRENYKKYKTTITKGLLIEPINNCALTFYKHLFSNLTEFEKGSDNAYASITSEFVEKLQERSTRILLPLVNDPKAYQNLIPKDSINLAKRELETIVDLLKDNFSLKNNIEARILYFQAYYLLHDWAEKDIDKKTLSECKSLLKQSILKEPNLPYPYSLLGLIALIEVDIKSMTENIERQIELIPNNSVFKNIVLSSIQFLSGHPENTIPLLKMAEKIYPKSDSIAYFLSAFYTVIPEMKNLDSATYFAKKALILSPKSTKYYAHYGSCLLQNNKMEEAITQYQKGLVIEPKNYDLITGLAHCYTWKNNYKVSIRLYKEAIKINPKRVHAYSMLGAVYEDLKDISEAKKTYESTLLFDTEIISDTVSFHQALKIAYTTHSNTSEYYDLGRKYDTLFRQPNEAIKFYKKVLSLDSTHLGSLEDLYSIYFYKVQNFEEGIKYAKKIFSIDSVEYEAYTRLGNCYRGLKEYQKSEDYLKMSLESSKKIKDQKKSAWQLSYLFHTLSSLSFEQNKYNETIDYAQRSIKADSLFQNNDLNFLFIASAYYFEFKKYGDALLNIEKAINLRKQQSSHYNLKSRIQKRLNKLDDALFTIQKAIELDSKDLNNYQVLGRIQILKGQIQVGLSNFEKGITLFDKQFMLTEPDFKDIQDNSQFKALLQKYFPEKK